MFFYKYIIDWYLKYCKEIKDRAISTYLVTQIKVQTAHEFINQGTMTDEILGRTHP